MPLQGSGDIPVVMRLLMINASPVKLLLHTNQTTPSLLALLYYTKQFLIEEGSQSATPPTALLITQFVRFYQIIHYEMTGFQSFQSTILTLQ